MAFVRAMIGIQPSKGISCNYLCDTVSDLPGLGDLDNTGCMAFVKDTKKFYVSKDTASWIEISVVYAPTGGNYVTFITDANLTSGKVLTAGSSITTATDATSFYVTAITNTYAGSAGLAGTGFYYIVGSSTVGLPFSKIISAGSSVTTHTDSTTFYINATTSALFTSGGLAGTGFYYIVGSSVAGLPFSKIITAGSSVTTATDSTSFYITAITNTYAGSGGLASTGGLFVVTSASPLFPNSRILTGGSSTSVRTDSTAFYVDSTTANALAFTITSRTINTIYPLGGGGDFSADRTHTVDTAFLVNSGRTISTTVPLLGGGDFSSNRTFSIDTAAVVTSGRTISTTSPGGGGGDLSADRTITIGSLSTIGSANQLIRVKTGGDGWEYINLVSGSNTTVSSVSGKMQIDVQNDKDQYWYKQFVAGTTQVLHQTFYPAGIVVQAGAPTTQLLGINSAIAISFLVTQSMRVDTMGCTVTVAGLNAVIRLGIYTNSADNVIVPFQSIFTSGVLGAASNVGLVTTQVNQTLSSNSLYWFVIQSGTAGSTFRSLPLTSVYPILGMDSGLGSVFRVGYITAAVFSNGLPATFSATPQFITTATIPVLAVRRSI